MRKLPVFVLALLFGLVSVGCDSADDDPSDAELFVGTWNLISLTDGERDKTADFATIANSFRTTLESDNEFEINVDYKEETGLTDRVIPGTYSVVEDAKTLILSPPVGPNVPFQYEILNESRIRLSTPAEFVNGMFQTDAYQGTVVITIEKAS